MMQNLCLFKVHTFRKGLSPSLYYRTKLQKIYRTIMKSGLLYKKYAQNFNIAKHFSGCEPAEIYTH